MKIYDNEFEYINKLVKTAPDQVESKKIENLNYQNQDFPIWSFSIGPKSEDIPVLALIGGVHGLEKVGTHVVLSYLNYVFKRLEWDSHFKELFKKIRLVSIPIVNPVGLANNWRANPNGVDLMRNAPIDSQQKVAPLVGGHRISNKLPWYRGHKNQMEIESQVLCDFIKEEVLISKFAQSIDFHSGFGLKDRLWYPYAKSTERFEELDSVDRVKKCLDNTIPHHIYTIEPQSINYTTHGDIWDYLYTYKKENSNDHHFIPWTLEMGSWIWFKKNPMQIFKPHGLFNPIKDHRFERVMRRHFLMMDFFLNLSANPDKWTK